MTTKANTKVDTKANTKVDTKANTKASSDVPELKTPRATTLVVADKSTSTTDSDSLFIRVTSALQNYSYTINVLEKLFTKLGIVDQSILNNENENSDVGDSAYRVYIETLSTPVDGNTNSILSLLNFKVLPVLTFISHRMYCTHFHSDIPNDCGISESTHNAVGEFSPEYSAYQIRMKDVLDKAENMLTATQASLNTHLENLLSESVEEHEHAIPSGLLNRVNNLIALMEHASMYNIDFSNKLETQLCI